jgi:hypothetical protein
MTHTTMYYPETRGVWDCPNDCVEDFEKKGWTTEPPPEVAAQIEAMTPVSKEFDPDEHGVKEVNAYIQSHPDDAERVLEAEAAGRGRKTITGE